MSTTTSLASTAADPAAAVTSAAAAAAAADPSSGSEPDHDDLDHPTITESSSGHNKRPQSAAAGGSGSGEPLTDKKLRRLEKNRLSARECRRRKREATEHLERQINILEAENLRLRLQLQIGQEAEDTSLQEQSKLTAEISALLQSGASEVEIYATLEEFKEKYADYGKSRRSAIEFHLRNIERLLMPTQTTSIVMTVIQGGDAAVGGAIKAATTPATSHAGPRDDGSSVESTTLLLDLDNTILPQQTLPAASAVMAPLPPEADARSSLRVTNTATTTAIIDDANTTLVDESIASAVSPSTTTSVEETTTVSDPPSHLDPKSLFKYLTSYLDVTPQQAAALKDSRFVAQELDGCLEKALGVLGELRQRLAQTGDDLDTEFNHVRSILTPTQAAKFLVWVANNKACMHMLNELWDRVYAAPEESSSSAEQDETPTHHD